MLRKDTGNLGKSHVRESLMGHVQEYVFYSTVEQLPNVAAMIFVASVHHSPVSNVMF
jgi:hypothetical protein